MTKVLLSLHVLAAILAVGPVAVAASMFPPVARQGRPDQVRLLHRICRVYAAIGIAVPLFGFATASALGVLGDVWLIISIALTALAAAVLVFQVLPAQEKLLPPPADEPTPAEPTPAGTLATRVSTRLAMSTGIFNLLWATVTVLMIVRPGSTTGV